MNSRAKRDVKTDGQHAVVSTAQDLRYRETVGGAPGRMTRFMHRYMDQVIKLATRKVAVRRVLLRTFNMLTPPSTLFQPRVLFQVLAQVLKPVGQQRERATRTQAAHVIERTAS